MSRKHRRERPLRIEIDFDARTVTFYNFRFLRDFWRNPPIPHVRCQFWDIRRAYYVPPGPRGGGDYLAVHTTRGRAVVLPEMTDFWELRDALEAIAEENGSQRIPLHCRRWFWPLVIVATLALSWLVVNLIWRAY